MITHTRLYNVGNESPLTISPSMYTMTFLLLVTYMHSVCSISVSPEYSSTPHSEPYHANTSPMRSLPALEQSVAQAPKLETRLFMHYERGPTAIWLCGGSSQLSTHMHVMCSHGFATMYAFGCQLVTLWVMYPHGKLRLVSSEPDIWVSGNSSR
jgi:hypothetical protein